MCRVNPGNTTIWMYCINMETSLDCAVFFLLFCLCSKSFTLFTRSLVEESFAKYSTVITAESKSVWNRFRGEDGAQCVVEGCKKLCFIDVQYARRVSYCDPIDKKRSTTEKLQMDEETSLAILN